MKKIQNYQPKWSKIVKVDQKWLFLMFCFKFFQKWYFAESWGFWVAFSTSKPFFWAIKINNPRNFLIFHPKAVKDGKLQKRYSPGWKVHPTPHQLVFNHSSTVIFSHRVFLRASLLRCWRLGDCWRSEYLKPPGPLYTHCFVNHLTSS